MRLAGIVLVLFLGACGAGSTPVEPTPPVAEPPVVVQPIPPVVEPLPVPPAPEPVPTPPAPVEPTPPPSEPQPPAEPTPVPVPPPATESPVIQPPPVPPTTPVVDPTARSVDSTIYQSFKQTERLTPEKPLYIVATSVGATTVEVETWVRNVQTSRTALKKVPDGTFTGVIDGKGVVEGVTLVVRVDLKAAQVITPAVDRVRRVSVRIVTIIAAGYEPTPPTEQQVREVMARFPVPSSVSITFDPTPYVTTLDLRYNDNWVRLLREFDVYRWAMTRNQPTSSDDKWYGVIRHRGSGITGISFMPSEVSIGPDANHRRWKNVMTHELGHALSLPHAPCGNVAQPDINYPYANAWVGPNTPFDLPTLTLISEVEEDVMSYCNGTHFSDYNYQRITTHLAVRTTKASTEMGSLWFEGPDGRRELIATGISKPAGSPVGREISIPIDHAQGYRKVWTPW